MRARQTAFVRMSTINPPLGNQAPPPLRLPGPLRAPSRLPPYLLRAGEIAALIAFLSFCVMWVQWQLAAPGFYTISGDFVSFWTAGELVLNGHAADAYREMPHFFKQLALHGDTTRLYVAFFYPPFFLLLCAGFALLSYFPALCLWLISTFLCYAAAIRALLSKCRFEGLNPWVLFLGYPAVIVNIGFGQNGFISTALFGGAAVLLDRRPEFAGLCFGCLAYKPQLGIIVPLALAVARRWRALFVAAATVVGLAGAATLAFGIGIWPPFLAVTAVARHNWMEAPVPSYLQFLITVFGAVRLHDGSLQLAYAAQAIVSITAVLMLVGALLKRPPGARSGTAEVAAIAACVPFCSPFMLEYDLVILAVPMAWLLGEALRDGFRRGEGVALALTFAAPALFKITAFDNALKLSVIAAAALLYVVVLRRIVIPAGLPARREGPALPGELGAAAACR
jgi:alpha-1,2-mannosyltransferase